MHRFLKRSILIHDMMRRLLADADRCQQLAAMGRLQLTAAHEAYERTLVALYHWQRPDAASLPQEECRQELQHAIEHFVAWLWLLRQPEAPKERKGSLLWRLWCDETVQALSTALNWRQRVMLLRRLGEQVTQAMHTLQVQKTQSPCYFQQKVQETLQQCLTRRQGDMADGVDRHLLLQRYRSDMDAYVHELQDMMRRESFLAVFAGHIQTAPNGSERPLDTVVTNKMAA